MEDVPAEAKLKRFFKLSADMLGIADFNGYFLDLNPSWEAILGFTRQELCAVPYLDFVHPEDRALTIAKAAALSGGAEVISFENRYRCRDGSYRWLEWNSIPVLDEGLIYFVARDVTERKELQDRHKAAEERLLALLHHLPISMWEVDTRGVLLYAGGKGLTSTGVQPEQILGKNVFDIYDEEQSAITRRGLAGEFAYASVEVYGKHWDSWTIPHRDAKGQITGVIGVSLDVSDVRRAEQELRDKLSLVERQQKVISSLSTPIIEVWDRVLTLPMLGVVDTVRGAEMMENLLASVSRKGARFAVLDLTGVDTVDTATAAHLIKLIQALGLLGAEGIITGVQPGVAQTMVSLGIDLAKVTTLATLRDGIKHAMARLPGAPAPASAGERGAERL